MTPLFHLENISHRYSEGLALDGITVTISKGGLFGLLGCNGAGKSTLLYILAGLVKPLQGNLSWEGKEISPALLKQNSTLRQEYRRRVSIAFQDPDAQWLCDTVLEEAMYGPAQIFPPEEAMIRAQDALQVMGVTHLAAQPPYALSGGEKRRVALASVIAQDPDVLLLDEPTASLDAATTDFLLDWLAEFITRPGKTVIMATHDISIIQELATQCLVLTPCHRLAAMDSTSAILNNTPLLRGMNLIGKRQNLALRNQP